MSTSINIHGVIEAEATRPKRETRICGQEYKVQSVKVRSLNGQGKTTTTEIDLFTENGQGQLLYTERDISDAKLDELNANTADFEASARGQITGHVQALYDDAEHIFPGPDDTRKLMVDALEAWLDMANGCSSTEGTHRAQAHRANLRAVAYEWEKWEDANQAELAICHAMVQAFYLWTHRATNPRFFNALAAALHGLGWGQGQLANR